MSLDKVLEATSKSTALSGRPLAPSSSTAPISYMTHRRPRRHSHVLSCPTLSRPHVQCLAKTYRHCRLRFVPRKGDSARGLDRQGTWVPTPHEAATDVHSSVEKEDDISYIRAVGGVVVSVLHGTCESGYEPKGAAGQVSTPNDQGSRGVAVCHDR